MSERYVVVEGSQSGHCCFEYTVVDTTKPWYGMDLHEPICECYSQHEAQQIADALNKSHE